LHNEVIPSVPRKFGVTRILRFKVTMQNTWEFYNMFPKQFGPFVAFDSGRCTAPHCNSLWEKYGFVVGCQNLDRNVANYPRDYRKPSDEPETHEAQVFVRKLRGRATDEEGEHSKDDQQKDDHKHRADSTTASPMTTSTAMTTATPVHDGFHSGIWYSLPGACPDSAVGDKNRSCAARMPGGHCEVVNGQKDCTYSTEFAGEISLDELSGILDESRGINNYDDWWKKSFVWCMNAVARGEQEGPCKHNMEYNPLTDRGVGTSFWDGKHDLEAGLRRMEKVKRLFREKYPQLPDHMEEPACL